MSFALYSGYTAFPSEMIKPLHKLLWLALDNNNIGPTIEPETALYNLGELQYLNLESNKLTKLPPNVLHHNVHKKLLGKLRINTKGYDSKNFKLFKTIFNHL